MKQLYVAIHCSDSPNGRPNTQNDIDAWHKERGFKRGTTWRQRFNPDLEAIGYHYVIGVKGEIWSGRHENEVGASVAGYNVATLGVCLIGKDRFSAEQWAALKKLVTQLREKYPGITVKGHREFSSAIVQGKTCPDFDVRAWLKKDMKPLEGHVYEK